MESRRRRRVRALARPKTSLFCLLAKEEERDLRVGILGRAASQGTVKTGDLPVTHGSGFRQAGPKAIVQRRRHGAYDPKTHCRRSRGKLDPKWDLVKKVFSNGVYQLATIEDGRIIPPVNGKFHPYPRKPVFFETRQSRESEDIVQVGFNTQTNSGIAQHLYKTQFARECTVHDHQMWRNFHPFHLVLTFLSLRKRR